MPHQFFYILTFVFCLTKLNEQLSKKFCGYYLLLPWKTDLTAIIIFCNSRVWNYHLNWTWFSYIFHHNHPRYYLLIWYDLWFSSIVIHTFLVRLCFHWYELVSNIYSHTKFLRYLDYIISVVNKNIFRWFYVYVDVIGINVFNSDHVIEKFHA